MQTLEEARRFTIVAAGLHGRNPTSVRAGLGWAKNTSDHVVDKEKRDGQRS